MNEVQYQRDIGVAKYMADLSAARQINSIEEVPEEDITHDDSVAHELHQMFRSQKH